MCRIARCTTASGATSLKRVQKNPGRVSLKRSARLRSEQTMERALAALHRMDASDRDINFRTVASEAKVSTAWLYAQEELRVRIMRSRKTTSRHLSQLGKEDRSLPKWGVAR